jgi:4-amino-4-deoxy-L-arabinose transferase-like glycosyltransferase
MGGNSALRLAVLLLLLAVSVQVLASVGTMSPTFDEPYHIVRSYVYLKTGDIALVARGGHPPLANMLSVAPLLLRSDIVLPAHQPGWPDVTSFKDLFRVADQFFWRIGNDAESMVFWSRLPMMLLSALLAGLVFLWAKQLNGTVQGPLASRSAGLLALLLYTFDPNILAHSSVVTTDFGATFFIFVSLFCLWSFCREPSWARLVLTGSAFGLAQATKFSALFLAPIFFVLLALWVFDTAGTALPLTFPLQSRLSGRPRLQRVYVVLALCCVIFIVGFVVLWGVYSFEVRPALPHENSHPLLDRFIPANNPNIQRMVYALAENVPIPAPAYFADLDWLRRYSRSGHPTFLMGRYAVRGWWYYFPIAFAIKTPIPLLILLAAAVYLSLRHREELRREYFLLVPMVLFFLMSMSSPIDIGYRNILPVLPLAFVYVSKVSNRFVTGKTVGRTAARCGRLALGLLCAWHVIGTVTLSPHFLAYFNESVGGPGSGYRYLVDSNLDWGQDLKNLKKYLDREGIRQIYLSYFGTADPAYYGIDFLPMPDSAPALDDPPAYYAISATSLQGVYTQGTTSVHWLAQYQPVERVGYSIFVYRLP